MDFFLVAAMVFLIALIFSMFGMGGGLFYMPVFLFVVKNPKVASLYSFSSILGTTFSALLVYRRHKLIDWRLVKYLGVPLVLMVFLSGFFLKILYAPWLKLTLGITLTLAGFLMVHSFKASDRMKIFFRSLQKKFPDKAYSVSPVILSPITFILGILAGISGVAGGVFEIPLMIGFLKVDPHKAIASSCVIVLCAAILGIGGRLAFNYADYSSANLYFLLLVFVCSFFGGVVGPNIILKVQKNIFKKICGIFILLMGIYYLATSVFAIIS